MDNYQASPLQSPLRVVTDNNSISMNEQEKLDKTRRNSDRCHLGRRRRGWTSAPPSLRRQHVALGARARRPARRSRSDISRMAPGELAGDRMARQAGVGDPPHEGDARFAESRRRRGSPIPSRRSSKQPDYAKNEYRSLRSPSAW